MLQGLMVPAAMKSSKGKQASLSASSHTDSGQTPSHTPSHTDSNLIQQSPETVWRTGTRLISTSLVGSISGHSGSTLVPVHLNGLNYINMNPATTVPQPKRPRICHALHYYTLLKKPRIVALSFMFLCSTFGYFGTYFTFPSLGREVSMTKLNAYLLISLPAATELVSRILFGLITDKGFVTKFRLLMISSLLSGSELLIFSFFPGEVSLLVC